MRSERHPAQEDHEDDDLGVRAVANKQAEVAAPDGLVDEPGGATEHEHRDERRDQSRLAAEASAGSPDGRVGIATYSNGVNKWSKQVPTCLHDRAALVLCPMSPEISSR